MMCILSEILVLAVAVVFVAPVSYFLWRWFWDFGGTR